MSIIPTNGDAARLPARYPDGLHQESPESGPARRDSLTLASLLTALRRHALLVLLSTFVIGGLTAFWVLREGPTYRATALLRLTDLR